MPDVSDPSFAREERRARARRAAAEASDERRQELRSKYVPPAPPPRQRSTGTSGRAQRDPSASKIDVTAFASSARAALDAHPSTWTSYAELCAANGLDRGMERVVARHLGPEPMGQHWYRIRNSDGVYDAPADRSVRGGPDRFGRAEADRALEALGVGVRAHRADPERKLLWMHGEWCLAGR